MIHVPEESPPRPPKYLSTLHLSGNWSSREGDGYVAQLICRPSTTKRRWQAVRWPVWLGTLQSQISHAPAAFLDSCRGHELRSNERRFAPAGGASRQRSPGNGPARHASCGIGPPAALQRTWCLRPKTARRCDLVIQSRSFATTRDNEPSASSVRTRPTRRTERCHTCHHSTCSLWQEDRRRCAGGQRRGRYLEDRVSPPSVGKDALRLPVLRYAR
jgi:hypothetical protein